MIKCYVSYQDRRTLLIESEPEDRFVQPDGGIILTPYPGLVFYAEKRATETEKL